MIDLPPPIRPGNAQLVFLPQCGHLGLTIITWVERKSLGSTISCWEGWDKV